MDKSKALDFLEEYGQLCKKYKMCIDSCGCCNSPWITDTDEKYTTLEKHIKHLEEDLNNA